MRRVTFECPMGTIMTAFHHVINRGSYGLETITDNIPKRTALTFPNAFAALPATITAVVI